MDTPQDFIILIMNCVKYRFKAEKQKESWISNLQKIPYYHVIGDEKFPHDYYFDDEERILWVKTPDDYNSLPKKVIAAYAAVRKHFRNMKYIFKTDDDQILQTKYTNSNKFFNMIACILDRKNPKVHYAGNIVDVPKQYLSQYHRIHPELPQYLQINSTKYCSGRFYILSIEAVCDLLIKREYINREYLEDYAIGLHLNEKYKQTIMHLDTNKFFADMQC